MSIEFYEEKQEAHNLTRKYFLSVKTFGIDHIVL